ncbi:uncharacterized protein TRAVEDRAFT_136522 [Trametes versicolor FP-101664 SS1]|uniref:Uncharacterized protein n=1 Tax=Trametes versicolor (strain FP-101664) TaxID=717944 RepID=R7S7Y2_TRAVS|nr:uncharacterized protein TRAVEDRAFT_136522 [Trametes versicolor FP-101664 SS1]EIW52106.1 hypothetical protein TRAVEDRAFT_136522 [Trametes versicolor FP-101664 SS1]
MGNRQGAAQGIIYASPPTNTRAFHVADMYVRGTHRSAGDAFRSVQCVFSGLNDLCTN